MKNTYSVTQAKTVDCIYIERRSIVYEVFESNFLR